MKYYCFCENYQDCIYPKGSVGSLIYKKIYIYNLKQLIKEKLILNKEISKSPYSDEYKLKIKPDEGLIKKYEKIYINNTI